MNNDRQNLKHDEVLTPEELAAYLKIGRTTAYALLSARVIESFTIGRRRLIRRSAVDHFLDERSGSDS